MTTFENTQDPKECPLCATPVSREGALCFVCRLEDEAFYQAWDAKNPEPGDLDEEKWVDDAERLRDFQDGER